MTICFRNLRKILLIGSVIFLTSCGDSTKEQESSSSANSSAISSLSSASSSSTSSIAQSNKVITENGDFWWKKSIEGSHETEWKRGDGILAPFNALTNLPITTESSTLELEEWLTYTEAYGFERDKWKWMQSNLNEVFRSVRDQFFNKELIPSGDFQPSEIYPNPIHTDFLLVSENFQTGEVVYHIQIDQELDPKMCPYFAPEECTTEIIVDMNLTLGALPGGSILDGKVTIVLEKIRLDINEFSIHTNSLSLNLSDNARAFEFNRLVFEVIYDHLDAENHTENNVNVRPLSSPFANIPPLREPAALAIVSKRSEEIPAPNSINLTGKLTSKNIELTAFIQGSFTNWIVQDQPDAEFNVTDSLKGAIESSDLNIKFHSQPKY